MNLVITQPTLLWIVGTVGVLLVVFFVLMTVVAFHLVKLMKFMNRQSTVIEEGIGELRQATHDVSSSLKTTSDHIAQFVTFTTSAAGVAKLFSTVRDTWQDWSGKRTVSAIDDAINNTPIHRRSTSRRKK